MRETVDFHHVPPQQTEIHERLRNWSRWVRVRPHGWQTHPMFRNAKTPRTLDVDAHIRVECDTLDALLIERTVSKMPVRHRTALRWFYVSSISVNAARKEVCATSSGLHDLVIDSRDMVKNLTR